MARFLCGQCGYMREVGEEYAGKKVICPKCKLANRVAGSERPSIGPKKDVIKFYCPGCGQKIGVEAKYAGKKVKCAKCQNPMTVPDYSQSVTAVPAGLVEKKSESSGEDFGGEDDFGFGSSDNMADLFDMEQGSKAIGRPVRVEKPAEEEFAGDGVTAAYAAGGGGFSWASGEEKGKKKRGMVTFVIAGVVIVFVLIIGIILFGGSSGEEKTQAKIDVDYTRVEEVGGKYLDLLGRGEVEESRGLVSDGMAGSDLYDQIGDAAEFVQEEGSFTITGREYFEDATGGVKGFILTYNEPAEGTEDPYVKIVFGKEGEDVVIEGIQLIHPEGARRMSIESGKANEIILLSFGSELTMVKKYARVFFVVIFVVAIVNIISLWAVFEKAGHPGWAIMVPFYNMWVFAEVGDNPGWMGLVYLFVGMVPVVGWLLSIGLYVYMCVGIAKAFDKGVLFGIGLAFLGFIFFPILAFS